MAEFEKAIKQWMEDSGFDREWLAARCGVEKRTVDNWLSSSRKVPKSHRAMILELMRTCGARSDYPGSGLSQNLVLIMDEAAFARYNAAAVARGMLIKDWALAVLDDASRRYAVDPVRERLPKVADGD